jgi:hypothetical protein
VAEWLEILPLIQEFLSSNLGPVMVIVAQAFMAFLDPPQKSEIVHLIWP